MHSDLGGFAGDYFDNELYLRWLQYGVFNPIFRPHAQEDVASEVARKDIVTKAKAKKCVELRYQLLPYNYTLAYQNSNTGIPLMRPLFFEEPKNEALQTVADTYLWGADFLIKPIVNPGITSTEVYFPNTANWFDFYTHKKYSGGKKATVSVVEDHIPTFVRANTLIPMTQVVQNTAAYQNSQLDVLAYLDGVGRSQRTFYFDNGTTPNAQSEEGNHALLVASLDVSLKKISLTLEQKNTGTTAEKKGTITLYNCAFSPKTVVQNGQKIPFEWNAKSKKITISYTHNQEKTSIVIN
jgi:alpha-glucosidase (family GH31 glycosyl hydrolase)